MKTNFDMKIKIANVFDKYEQSKVKWAPYNYDVITACGGDPKNEPTKSVKDFYLSHFYKVIPDINYFLNNGDKYSIRELIEFPSMYIMKARIYNFNGSNVFDEGTYNDVNTGHIPFACLTNGDYLVFDTKNNWQIFKSRKIGSYSNGVFIFKYRFVSPDIKTFLNKQLYKDGFNIKKNEKVQFHERRATILDIRRIERIRNVIFPHDIRMFILKITDTQILDKFMINHEKYHKASLNPFFTRFIDLYDVLAHPIYEDNSLIPIMESHTGQNIFINQDDWGVYIQTGSDDNYNIALDLLDNDIRSFLEKRLINKE